MENTTEGKTTQERDAYKFEVNPATRRIIYDGDEYADTPKIREFIRRANEIKKGLPEVAKGHTRLWRGNRPGEVGQNPSFTSSLVGIALPFINSYEGELSYVDISSADASKYLRNTVGSTDAEYLLPPELAKKATVAEDSLRPQPTVREAPARPEGNPHNPQGWDITGV